MKQKERIDDDERAISIYAWKEKKTKKWKNEWMINTRPKKRNEKPVVFVATALDKVL